MDLSNNMAGILDEFDEPTPLKSSFCSRLTEEEYEEQSSAYTQAALESLMEYMDTNPDVYSKIVKKRKKEEAENAGLVSFVKV